MGWNGCPALAWVPSTHDFLHPGLELVAAAAAAQGKKNDLRYKYVLLQLFHREHILVVISHATSSQ